jgi:hypothetical protein
MDKVHNNTSKGLDECKGMNATGDSTSEAVSTLLLGFGFPSCKIVWTRSGNVRRQNPGSILKARTTLQTSHQEGAKRAGTQYPRDGPKQDNHSSDEELEVLEECLSELRVNDHRLVNGMLMTELCGT